MDSVTLAKIKDNPELLVRYVARDRFATFARYIKPELEMTNYHKVYYEILNRFAHKKISKLIVSMSPQSGKSEGSSRLLPAFLLGLNPNLKIVVGSYNTDQARSFNADVQRIIQSEAYSAVFPDTYLNTAGLRRENVYKCNADVSEPVGHSGFLRACGRSSSLTGKSVDVSILDDVYKDYAEANSNLIREQAWKWYTTVVRTRLHNESQELIVFTRWHEDDIIGRIEKSGEKIIVAKTWADIEDVPKDTWILLNFPAIKEGEPTELDPRIAGEALWPSHHSIEQLMAQKALDPVLFQCLYQGNPSSEEGRLYGQFKTYVDKTEYGTFIRKGCYVDVADKGDDYLCSICYDVYKSPNSFYNEQKRKFEPIIFILVTDVLYTQDGTEITSVSVPRQINEQGAQLVWIESNNGGEGFANVVSKKVRAIVKKTYTTSNKESRIVSSVSQVMASVIFPIDWETRFPLFAEHLHRFLRLFSANTHDDAPDCISSLIIKELDNTKPYSSFRRGIRRGN